MSAARSAVLPVLASAIEGIIASDGGGGAAPALDWEGALLRRWEVHLATVVGSAPTLVDTVSGVSIVGSATFPSNVSVVAAGTNHPTQRTLNMTSDTGRFTAPAPLDAITGLMMVFAFKRNQFDFAAEFVGRATGAQFGFEVAATSANVTLYNNQQSAVFNARFPKETTAWHTCAFQITDGLCRLAVDTVEFTPDTTDYVGTRATGLGFTLGRTINNSCRAHLGDFYHLDPTTPDAWEKLLLAELDIRSRYVP